MTPAKLNPFRHSIPVLVAAALALGASVADAQEETHGAMPMDEQKERLAKLLPERDVTKAPAAVDPVIWEMMVPDDNEMTEARVELGRRLYFETGLSADGTVACATCHDVSRGFTDQRMVSEGIGGNLGQRNSPTTMNAFFMESQFWDGRSADLEDQAKLPPINPIEMGQPNHEAVVAAIADDEEYRRMFQEAYGSEPNIEDMARAIAAFERTFVFLNAPFAHFLAGDEDAISEQAKRGWELFNGKARCVSCHRMNLANPVGTDNRFHNIGVAARAQNFEELARRALDLLREDGDVEAIDELALQTNLSELGRFMVSKNRADIGAFKTPQLANVGITAPYMHDGSMQTLWDVMDHYNKGGEPNPFLDGGIFPLALTESEISELVAFMFTLTDERFSEQNRQALEEQMARAREKRPFRDEDMAFSRVLPFEQRVMGEQDSGQDSGE